MKVYVTGAVHSVVPSEERCEGELYIDISKSEKEEWFALLQEVNGNRTKAPVEISLVKTSLNEYLDSLSKKELRDIIENLMDPRVKQDYNPPQKDTPDHEG